MVEYVSVNPENALDENEDGEDDVNFLYFENLHKSVKFNFRLSLFQTDAGL